MGRKKRETKSLVFLLVTVVATFMAMSLFSQTGWSKYYPTKSVEDWIVVPVDIKPGLCPNALILSSSDRVSVAILGAHNFDVKQIVRGSVRLEGVRPFQTSLKDVAKPYKYYLWGKDSDDVRADYCNTMGPDGKLDLLLTFDKDALKRGLGSVKDGEVRVLRLSGRLNSGMSILGDDVVVIRK